MGIIEKTSEVYVSSLIFLVSQSDWRLPLALEAVRSKFSPRVRSECLQSAYKIASKCYYLDSMPVRALKLT